MLKVSQTHLAERTKENENLLVIVSANVLHLGLTEIEFAGFAILTWNLFDIFNFCLVLKLTFALKLSQIVQSVLSFL